MTKYRVTAALIAAAGLSAAGLTAPAHAQAGFDWTGPYIGASAGYGEGHTAWSNIVVPSDTGQNYASTFSSSNPSGMIGGVQVGYNFVSGQMLYGVEAGIYAGNIAGTDVCFGSPSYGDYSADCKTQIKSMAELTGRVGVISADRSLVYLRGGASMAQARLAPRNEVGDATHTTVTGGYGWTNQNRVGAVVGIGFEYALNPTSTLGIEFDYRDYGKKSTSFTGVAPINVYNPDFSADTTLNAATIMVRYSVKF